MSKVKPELSKKSPLYIDKHTFYSVYHFALQYPSWKQKYAEMIGSATKGLDYDDMPHGTGVGDPTSRIAIRTYSLKSKINAVESIAHTAGKDLWRHLLYGVTHEGVTYEYLRSGRNKELGKILCGRNQYYQMRRLFYYLLAEKMEEISLKS